MRPPVPLAVVYLLVAALLVPGSPLAAEEPPPPAREAPAPAQPGPAETQSESGAEPQPAPAETQPPPGGQTQPSPRAETQPPGAETQRAPGTQTAAQSPAEPPAAAAPPAKTAAMADRVAAAKADAPDVTGRRKRRASRARAAAVGRVTIRDFAYAPATISVGAGDSVTWTNRDSADHSATGRDFDTGVLSGGQSGSFTFREAGTFSYVCSIHPDMKGTVRVAAAGEEPPAPDSGEPQNDAGTAPAAPDGGGQDSDDGPSLPRTGADEGWLAALGALLLGAGLVTRRRAGEG